MKRPTTPAFLISLVGVFPKEGLHFTLRGSLKHLPGALADIVIQGDHGSLEGRLQPSAPPQRAPLSDPGRVRPQVAATFRPSTPWTNRLPTVDFCLPRR